MPRREPGRRRDRRRLFDMPPAEDVGREVRFHIDMKVEELVAQGWSPDAARAEAERRFGDRDGVEDEARRIVERHRRAVRRAGRWETMWLDVRFGARTLLRRPAFTIVAVLTLGLGVGANAAVFSVIQRLLLAPLPYADADRLVRLWEVSERGTEIPFAEPNFFDVRDRLRAVESVATHPTFRFGGPLTVLGGNRPSREQVAFVSGSFFDVMETSAVRGRLPTPEEARPGAEPVAVVALSLWSDLLGAEPDLSRLSLEVGSRRYQVIGVLPRGFEYPNGSRIWVPADPNMQSDRTSHNYAVVGRLRAGVTLDAARTEATALARSLRAQHGENMNAVDFRVLSLRDELYGDYRRPLLLLLGAAAIVLLVACTNLASTLLARASAREQEFAVRTALGAGRARVVRQLFNESLLLALLGAIAGVVFAALSLRALTVLAPSSALRDGGFGVGPAVMAFALAASIFAALVFGLLPALRATRGDLAATLREGGRGGVGARAGVWNALVITEAALALVLLVSSALLLRAFVHTLDADPGFEPAGVVVAGLSVPTTRYPNDTTIAVLHARILDAARAVPGVESAGMVSHLPFGGSGVNGGLRILGAPDAEPYADYRVASAGYFETLRIPLLRGRAFDDRDRIGTETVALVSRSFADRFLAEGDPVGRQLADLSNDSWYYGRESPVTIIGVVDDVLHRGFLAPPAATVYVCACQRAYWMSGAQLVVRTTEPIAGVVDGLRTAIAGVEREMPVQYTLMRDVMRATVADRRFSLIVLAAFSALTLLLAAVGIYGVVSYGVARRRREMGIRLALGAYPAGVARLVVRHALAVVSIGIALGIAGAAIAARLISAQLAGAPGLDPLTVAATAAILLVVAFAASWIPARRVIRIDPLSTLRSE